MLIGVLSDSHVRAPGTRVGLSTLTAERLPPQVLAAFKGVDLILHAGDIYTVPVLDLLETVAPVLASEGDDDPFEVVNDPRVKHEQLLKLDGVTIWMSHYGLWPEHLVGEMPDVVIFGHTHSNSLERRNGSLWLNPGSCNFPKYQHTLGTVGLLTVKGGQAAAHVIQLEGEVGGGITSGVPGKF
ncbi:MAG: metallophosphoesterase family protein [Dehalococcoidia bacterium]|nr:metallophosphoesterase family protein [Dehalococcoidia bacterium]